MSNWNKRIGQYARAHKEEESEVDKELQQQAMGARYGYEQSNYDEDDEYVVKSKIYQSYDQTGNYPGEAIPTMENEAKDHYSTISLDAEGDKKNEDKNTDTEVERPLTKRIILELIVCVLAFVGRGLCLNSVGPTLIDLRQIARISTTQSAFIFISQSTGFLIGSVIAKPLLQRFNSELVLSVLLFIQAVCTAFIPAFRSIAVMCIMFVGQGLAIGVVGIGVCATCIRLGGKTRNGMFLQVVYLGVSIGSVLGPFIASPFLSTLARHTDNHDLAPMSTIGQLFGKNARDAHTNLQLPQHVNITTMVHENTTLIPSNSTTPLDETDNEFNNYSQTKVHFYYIFVALILCVPAACFLTLYFKRKELDGGRKEQPSKSEPLLLSACTLPLSVAVTLLFIQCLLYFGIQDTYSNLLTTFAVKGPLKMSKHNGVYLASLFWASMCFGRLNGVWIAKFVSPFKMLLVDISLALVAASGLLIFGGIYTGALWGLTAMLGLAFASINGATVSWAAQHLPENNYILSIIMVGRCTGLLLLPTIVTAVFKSVGAMSLMSALFVCVLTMIVAVLINQVLAHRYGIAGRLHTATTHQHSDNTEGDN